MITQELEQERVDNKLRLQTNTTLEAQVRRLHEEVEVSRRERNNAFEGHERLRHENEAMYHELQSKCELCEELTKHRKEDAKTLAEARREVAQLNELVAQLSGHGNSKQKIQRVMKIEQDNMALRKENMELRNKLRELHMRVGTGKEPHAAASKSLEVPKRITSMKVDPNSKPGRLIPQGALSGKSKLLTQPKTPQLHADSRLKQRLQTSSHREMQD